MCSITKAVSCHEVCSLYVCVRFIFLVFCFYVRTAQRAFNIDDACIAHNYNVYIVIESKLKEIDGNRCPNAIYAFIQAATHQPTHKHSELHNRIMVNSDR